MFLFSCKEDIKLSSEASLTTLTLTIESTDYEITFKNKQGTIELPYAMKLPVKARVAAVELSAKAKGVKVGDTVTILASEPLTLTVTAEDETTTQEYTVTVQKANPNSEASITTLTLTVGSTDYEIAFADRAYTLILPAGSTLPARVGVKTIALSSGATTDAGDQLSVRNNAVTIRVTAEDKTTTQEYTVRLVESVSITSFTFEVPDNESMALDTADRKRIVGKIDHEAKTITFDKQSAYVYLDKLIATFEVSKAGAAVQVENEDQESGVTEQEFSTPVSYVVSAEGTETTTYRVTLTKSTRATIPDAQFRAKLKEFFPDAFTGDQLDIMHDDVVNQGALLDVQNQTPKLTSLKGIEFFTALDTLYCYENSLTSLDVRRNTALTLLACTSNALTSLDVSGNTALTGLYCQNNSMASLDVSKNTALETLYCGSNSLTSLDVRVNTALTYLNCGGNSLTSLDVRGNTALTGLSCISNGLTSLDVSENTALMGLYCSSNSLTSLDVSANTVLTQLGCRDNSLTSLDMTGMRSVLFFGALNIGTGIGTDLEPDNHLLATLRVNTAVQDRGEIITMKTNRGTDLTITTVNNDGDVVCNDYDPAETGGTCNQAP